MQLNTPTTSQANFLIFSVDSKADLQAMRKALVSTAEYIEADLTAFITNRSLKDAISTRKQFNIPFGSIKPFPARPDPLKPEAPVTILKPAPTTNDVTVKLDDTVEGSGPTSKPDEPPPAATMPTPTPTKHDNTAKVDGIVEGSEYRTVTAAPQVTRLTPIPITIQKGVVVQLNHIVHGSQLSNPAETIATTPNPSAPTEPKVTILDPAPTDRHHNVQLDHFVDRLRPMSKPRILDAPKVTILKPVRLDKDELVQVDDTVEGSEFSAGPPAVSWG